MTTSISLLTASTALSALASEFTSEIAGPLEAAAIQIATAAAAQAKAEATALAQEAEVELPKLSAAATTFISNGLAAGVQFINAKVPALIATATTATAAAAAAASAQGGATGEGTGQQAQG